MTTNRDCRCVGVVHSHQCEIESRDALLKERDATIEELQKQIKCLQEWGERDERGRKVAEKDLAAEKERAEAYRELCFKMRTLCELYHRPGQERPMDFDIEAEARKLLAERKGRKV